jgi:biotin carboxyl carrier protein
MNRTSINIGEFSLSFDENRSILTDSTGRLCSADVVMISPGEFSVLVDGHSFHLFLNNNGNGISTVVQNFTFPIEIETFRDRLSKQLYTGTGTNSASMTLRAPMPGLITKIMKSEGTSIASGEGILIIEAMKMENEIKATRTGILKKIFVTEKQTVEKNEQLFIIE